ncbi:MAG: GGDEF domain-containing protein [Deltaproteobacteria bacterium]|nr:GGDEF domain-containing protein [Deltaproteobacteria bacterium]
MLAKAQDIQVAPFVKEDATTDNGMVQAETLKPLQKVLDRAMDLPSPPAIAVKVLDAVKDDQESFRALAQVISSDPALTAKMLKVANSSIYGLARRVDSIEMALTVLGSKALKNIALSFVIVGEFQNACQGSFDFTKFWKGSITSAVAAEMYSSMLGEKSDDTFVSALLQNIGYLVMFLTQPKKFFQLMSQGDGPRSEDLKVEKKIFGYDHQEFGAALLKSWGLPETIYMPILSHHVPEQSQENFHKSASILFISHQLSLVYQGFNPGEKARLVQKLLNEKYQFPAEKAEKLIDSIAEKASEILITFEMGDETIKPYSQLLQEANQDLGNLNLSYEQLILDLKSAKDEAENLAANLIKANQSLRNLVFRDGLTGLFNHRYFQEMLEMEMDRSNRHSHFLSLIFFDIDYFKKINDCHGHLAGDHLLKSLAARVTKIIRSSDILARYGGEEFAVIMPETDSSGLRVFAERVRRGIEQMNVELEGRTVQVTVSIGGTTMGPDLFVNDKRLLIQAADQAVYQSKNQGRNKFTFLPLEDFC